MVSANLCRRDARKGHGTQQSLSRNYPWIVGRSLIRLRYSSISANNAVFVPSSRVLRFSSSSKADPMVTQGTSPSARMRSRCQASYRCRVSSDNTSGRSMYIPSNQQSTGHGSQRHSHNESKLAPLKKIQFLQIKVGVLSTILPRQFEKLFCLL